MWLFIAIALGRRYTRGNGWCVQGSQKKSSVLLPLSYRMHYWKVWPVHVPAARLPWSLSWENAAVFCISIQERWLLCPIKPKCQQACDLTLITQNSSAGELCSLAHLVILWIKPFQILFFLPDCSSVCLVCTNCSWKGSTGKKHFQILPRDWELFLIRLSLSLCTQLGMKSSFFIAFYRLSGT